MTADEQPRGQAREQPDRGDATGDRTTGNGQAGAPKRRPSPRPRPQSEGKPAAPAAGRSERPTTAATDKPATARPATARPATDKPAPDKPAPDKAAPAATEAGAAAFTAELQALRAEVDERTRDLQRVTAEYANYRKRVDRDRGLVAEQATGSLLSALLPVLDDLDRARDHGDLVGPFGAVAEQLNSTLAKFGLTPFGEAGDAFDPMRHEAVAHSLSADVSEPTCVDVLRRGYMLGERLLRAPLVAVADPAPEAAAEPAAEVEVEVVVDEPTDEAAPTEPLERSADDQPAGDQPTSDADTGDGGQGRDKRSGE